jgi:hypothetical protein
MKSSRRVPGLLPAIGAFVLTVLLGVGGTAASALWQQSATATMTVTADGTWPGSFTLSCTNGGGNNSGKDPVLSVTATKAPANLTFYKVLNPSDVYTGPKVTAQDVPVAINLNSSGIFGTTYSAGSLTIRVVASFAGESTSPYADITLTLEPNGDKKNCPTGSVTSRI